jgi:hypothetical protein
MRKRVELELKINSEKRDAGFSVQDGCVFDLQQQTNIQLRTGALDDVQLGNTTIYKKARSGVVRSKA